MRPGQGKTRRTDRSGLDELALDGRRDVTRDVDEGARRGGAVAVAVPDDGDHAARDLRHQPDRLDAVVARCDREPRGERDAEARGDEPPDRAVVVGAEAVVDLVASHAELV